MIDFQEMRRLIRVKSHLEEAIARTEANATKRTASLSKSGGGGKGSTSSRVEEGAVALAILREEYNQVSNELNKHQAELKRYLRYLSEVERSIMRMRYMEGISCHEIAVAVCYSYYHVFHIVQAAESKINKRLRAPGKDSKP